MIHCIRHSYSYFRCLEILILLIAVDYKENDMGRQTWCNKVNERSTRSWRENYSKSCIKQIWTA